MQEAAPLFIARDIVISSFNTIDYYNLNKDFYQIPKSHTYWEMVYVDKGEVISVYDGVGHTLMEGQLVFHPPHSMHAHISNNLVSNSILVVSFSSDSEILNTLQRKIFTVSPLSKKFISYFVDEANNTFGDIVNFSSGIPHPLVIDNAQLGTTQLMECYFLMFLYSVIRDESYEVLKKSDLSHSIISSSFTELIKRYMRDNISSNLTLYDLCKKFNVSQSNLFKKWKDNCNIGIMEYFLNLKIDEAKRLITENEYNITQISEMLGYSTIHHFSHSFKKSVGMSPSEYKRFIKK